MKYKYYCCVSSRKLERKMTFSHGKKKNFCSTVKMVKAQGNRTRTAAAHHYSLDGYQKRVFIDLSKMIMLRQCRSWLLPQNTRQSKYIRFVCVLFCSVAVCLYLNHAYTAQHWKCCERLRLKNLWWKNYVADFQWCYCCCRRDKNHLERLESLPLKISLH